MVIFALCLYGESIQVSEHEALALRGLEKSIQANMTYPFNIEPMLYTFETCMKYQSNMYSL